MKEKAGELQCYGGEESTWCFRVNLSIILTWRSWSLVEEVDGSQGCTGKLEST
jgi:hypothetical protein